MEGWTRLKTALGLCKCRIGHTLVIWTEKLYRKKTHTSPVFFHVCLPIWKKSLGADRELKNHFYVTPDFSLTFLATSHAISILILILADTHTHTFSLSSHTVLIPQFYPSLCHSVAEYSLFTSTFSKWPYALLVKRHTQGPAVFFVRQSHNRIPWLMKAAAAVGISSAIITASRNWTSLLVSPVVCLSHLRQSFKPVGDYTFILPQAIRTNMKSVLSKEISPAFVKSAGEVALVSHCFLFVVSAWTSAWSARKCFH